MRNLVPVGDVVIDTNEVVMVKGSSVLLRERDNGLVWIGVGVEAADAIRRYVIAPAAYWDKLGQSASTSDKAQAGGHTLPESDSSQEESLEAEEPVLHLTCVITSFPADETAKAKDGMSEEEEARKMGKGK